MAENRDISIVSAAAGIVAVFALGAILVFMLLGGQTSEEADAPSDLPETTDPSGPSSNSGSLSRTDPRHEARREKPAPGEQKRPAPDGRRATSDERRTTRGEERTTSDERRGPNAREVPEPGRHGGLDPSHRDATAEQSSPANYDDPVNRRVLGPRRWMREMDDEQREAIRREIHRDVGSVYEVSVRDRRKAIRQVENFTRVCFQEHFGRRPDVTGGQLIVIFELVVSGGTASATDVSTEDPVGVRDPDFRACVESSVSEIGFPAERDGRMSVEHPVFLGSRELSR